MEGSKWEALHYQGKDELNLQTNLSSVALTT